MRYLPALAVTLLALASFTHGAADDGRRAGLVIDWGDGGVSTHCVAFTEDSLAGDELLSRAGYPVNQFSGLVCGIGGTGCAHAGSFRSCLCECPSGGPDCTYWAFFTLPPNATTWRYSALGFQAQRVRDGEMHGWIWATGQPGRVSPPPSLTFDAVCTAAVPTSTPTPTAVPPTPLPTPSPGQTPTPTRPGSPAQGGIGSTPAPADTPAAAPTTASPASPSPPPPATQHRPTSTPTPPSVTTPSVFPGPPATGDQPSGAPAVSLILFAVAAAGLAAVIAGGFIWRRRHGS